MAVQSTHRKDAEKAIGFLVNPVAGMGGRVGLKGTDGMADQARAMGAESAARQRALEALRPLTTLLRSAGDRTLCRWETCAGEMGESVLREAGIAPITVVHDSATSTSAADTLAVCRIFAEHGVDLILFCGGDGTARDICQVVGTAIPILGIPAGVKMYSGVFAATPRHVAAVVHGFLNGEIRPVDAEILDLDEEAYRKGQWVARLFTTAMVPGEPRYVQPGKSMIDGATEDAAKADIAEHLAGMMANEPDVLWVLGAGSTTQAIAGLLGIRKSLLDIDAIHHGRLVGNDLNESGLLALLRTHGDSRLVLSPIGAQGFVLGRGNSPLSARVIRAIGPDHLVIVSTPGKLRQTPGLRFDTGDPALDEEFTAAGYLPVVVGYQRTRMVPVQK